MYAKPVTLVAALGALLFAAGTLAAPASRGPESWVAAWAAAPEPADSDPDEPLLNLDGQTVRQRVRVSVGGTHLRVRLSNEYGATPLAIGSATVALPADAAGVQPKSLRPLTFSGRTSITIPAGAPVLSDAIDIVVGPDAEISISVYFPERVATPTLHGLALKRAVVSSRGDFTRASRIETRAESHSSIAITAVLVPAQPGQRLIVAMGDSITDGDGSTADADRTWPAALVRRLNARKGGTSIAVVNEGIAGNRLLADGHGIKILGSSALSRFDRDVLSVPGVTHVVLMQGVNDIGMPGATLHGQPLAAATETPTTADLIGALQQLIARAHSRGLRVIGATILPFEGTELPGYYTEAKDTARRALNDWIRTSGAYDAVIDFDAVLRDPAHPSRLQARYASPDHLHPNDGGYQAMADAIDLSRLQ